MFRVKLTYIEYLNELADLLFNLQEFITVIGSSSYPVISLLYPLGKLQIAL